MPVDVSRISALSAPPPCNPAIFLGIDDSFGTIEPRKVADLARNDFT